MPGPSVSASHALWGGVPASARRPLRVLYVDDSPDNAALAVREIARAGYDVVHERVDTPATLRDALARGGWDVVLSDCTVAAPAGLGALSVMAQQGVSLPFVIVAGPATAGVAVRAGVVARGPDGDLGLVPAIERALSQATGPGQDGAHGPARGGASVPHLQMAVEQSEDLIVITDPDGTIEYVNPAFERTTGYAADEVIGKTPRVLKSGRQDRDFYRALWDTVRSGETWTGRVINRRKDGTVYTEDQRITPVTDAAGRVTHFVAVKRDVTRQLSQEAQLRQAQRMESVGQLASGIAHDFNNVLTGISGYTLEVLEGLSEDDPRSVDLRQVLTLSDRGAALARQLLTFSRRDAPERTVTNLRDVTDDALHLVRRLVGAGIDVVVPPAPDLGACYGDVSQLQQVIVNLVVNARDAMPDGGTITIRLENQTLTTRRRETHRPLAPGAYVSLSVADTGTGMDEATRRRLFEPFFTTKAPGQGTGLGLSTVQGIVEEHDGAVEVWSEPGAGSVFTVWLPRREAAER